MNNLSGRFFAVLQPLSFSLRRLGLLLVLLVAFFQTSLPAQAASQIDVTTTADELNRDGDCSLREAITAANSDLGVDACPAGSGADLLVLAPGEIYSLSTVDNITDGANGLPSISSTLIISGQGATLARAAAAPDLRIFHVAATGNLTLQQLTVRNGHLPTVEGGGAYNRGHLLIQASTFADNYAHGGSGIFNEGSVIVSDSTFSANTTPAMSSGGGAIHNSGGTLAATNSLFTTNGTGTGGALYLGGGPVILDRVTFSANHANAEGGGIFNSGPLTITNSSFVTNTAGRGAGIFTMFRLTIGNSTFSNNSATQWGGGIHNEDSLTAYNITFSHNSAGVDGGAFYAYDRTGTLYNTTFIGNAAGGAGGALYTDNGTIVLYNTIIANSPSGENCAIANGAILDGSHNLDSANTCGFSLANGSLVNTDPLLGPLADSGAPVGHATLTHALLPGSPALDAGDDTVCAGPPVNNLDQRGVTRPQGAHCDIGAYEKGLTPPVAIDDAAVMPQDTLVILDLLANDSDADGDALTLLLVNDPPHGEVIQSSNLVTYTPDAGFSGADSFSYLVGDGYFTVTGYVNIFVTAAGGGEEPPVVAPVDPNAETTLAFTNSTSGKQTTVAVPPGAVAESITLVYQEAQTPPTEPGGFQFGGRTFTLDAYVDGQAAENFQFNQPVLLTLSYDDSGMSAEQEAELTLLFFDITTNSWSATGISKVGQDMAANTARFLIEHLTDFGLFTPAGPPPAPTLLLSSNSNGSVGTLAYRDEDILVYRPDSNNWAMLFDGSNVGVGGSDLDAFAQLANGNLLLSFDSDFTVSGYGRVDDADILQFTPVTLGANNTRGSFQLYFDGSDVGLGSSDEDIDAIDVDAGGNLLISVRGAFSAPGVAGSVSGADEDLFRLRNGVFGAATSGQWELAFDGSDVGLTQSSEDIHDLWVDPSNGDLYLTTEGSFAVTGGLQGDQNDIFLCQPLALGATTHCTFALYWDGGSHGLGTNGIDGLHVGDEVGINAAAIQRSAVALIDDTVAYPGDDIDAPSELDGSETTGEEEQNQHLYLPLMAR